MVSTNFLEVSLRGTCSQTHLVAAVNSAEGPAPAAFHDDRINGAAWSAGDPWPPASQGLPVRALAASRRNCGAVLGGSGLHDFRCARFSPSRARARSLSLSVILGGIGLCVFVCVRKREIVNEFA